MKKEDVDKIKDIIEVWDLEQADESLTMIMYKEDIESMRKAIEALEKQIPKAPVIKEWNPAYCPCCHRELSDSIGDGYYMHWIGLQICECGQKLDWDKDC